MRQSRPPHQQSLLIYACRRELSDIWQLIEQCEARLSELGVQRVFCTMTFASLRDKNQSMADKLNAVS